ncbi:hypothetical protein SRHO_G00008170 [Serrasalmus rhombeus]
MCSLAVATTGLTTQTCRAAVTHRAPEGPKAKLNIYDGKEDWALRFGQKEPPTTARRRLGELQQSKETVMEFAEVVHKLIMLAYPGVGMDLKEQIAADAFLKGLRNQKIAYEVMNRDPTTLDEAQRLVATYEHNFRATLGRDLDPCVRTRRVSWADQDTELVDEDLPMQSRRVQAPTYVTQNLLQTLIDKVNKLQLVLGRLPSPSSNAILPPPTVSPHQEGGRGAAGHEGGNTKQPYCGMNKTRLQSPSPTRRNKGPCFLCGEEGHFRRNCSCSPSPSSTSQPVKAVQPKVVDSVQHQLPCLKPGDNVSGENVIHVGWAESRGPSLLIVLSVDGIQVNAVIDTGAEATIMSEETFNTLLVKNHTSLKKVSLRNAETGKEMIATGGVMVEFKIGTKTLQWDICVAPIHDALLLGLDFLKAADFTIHASVDNPKPEVPTVLEPVCLADGLSSGSVMIKMEHRIPVRLCNVSASSKPLARGTFLGLLVEAYPDASQSKEESCMVSIESQPYIGSNELLLSQPGLIHETDGDTQYPSHEVMDEHSIRQIMTISALDLPEYLKELYTASSEALTETQQKKLINLLIEHQSVFAATNDDLGTFSAVKHRIDTGHAKPVRQPVRRTPLGF